MAIPVDADAGVSESFIAAVQRDILVDLFLVLIYIIADAVERGLFLDRENENQIAPSFDLRFVQGANRGQQSLDVPGIVADPRRVNLPLANRGFDLQSGLKHAIHVCIKNNQRPVTRSFAYGNESSH